MAWLCIWVVILNNSGGLWSNGVGEKRETYKEHDEDCVGEGFSWVKLDRNGEKGREALDMGKCSINIWDGSELTLA